MMYLSMAFLVLALVPFVFGTIGAAAGAAQVLCVILIMLGAGSLLASAPRLARLAAHRLVDPFIR